MASMAVIVATGGSVVDKVPFHLCIEIICKIVDCIKTATRNDEDCQYIVRKAEAIQGALEDLQRAKEITNGVGKAVSLLEVELKRCEEYIDWIYDRDFSIPRHFVEARGIASKLRQLKGDLDGACTAFNLNANVQLILHSQKVDIRDRTKTSISIPGKPRTLRISKRGSDKVQLTWSVPTENAGIVHCYEVYYRKRYKKWQPCEKRPTSTTHTVTGLSADTKYWFRVRALNADKDPVAGLFSDEINGETKFSGIARGFMYAGVGALGVLSSPVVAPAMAVMAIHEGRKGREGVVTTAAVTGLAASPAAPPIIGAAMAYMLHEEIKPDSFSEDD